MMCDGSGRDDHGVPIGGRPVHGCAQCCDLCNLDRHICPGCGADINHGVGMCLRCRNRKDPA